MSVPCLKLLQFPIAHWTKAKLLHLASKALSPKLLTVCCNSQALLSIRTKLLIVSKTSLQHRSLCYFCPCYLEYYPNSYLSHSPQLSSLPTHFYSSSQDHPKPSLISHRSTVYPYTFLIRCENRGCVLFMDYSIVIHTSTDWIELQFHLTKIQPGDSDWEESYHALERKNS